MLILQLTGQPGMVKFATEAVSTFIFCIEQCFESKSYKNLCVSIDITVNSPIPTGLKGLFQKFYRAMMTHQETVPFLIVSKKQAPSKSHTDDRVMRSSYGIGHKT